VLQKLQGKKELQKLQRWQDASGLPVSRGKLDERIRSFDLTELEIDPDGNCQFAAFARAAGGSEDHSTVRERVVSELLQNQEEYGDFVRLDADPKIDSFAAYAVNMANAGEWGDNVTLQAMVNGYNREVMMITSFDDDLNFVKHVVPRNPHFTTRIGGLLHAEDHSAPDAVLMAFHSEIHYTALQLPNESGGDGNESGGDGNEDESKGGGESHKNTHVHKSPHWSCCGRPMAHDAPCEDPLAALREMYKMDGILTDLGKMQRRLAVDSQEGKSKEYPDSYLFLGGPGTGKTTVARVMASILNKIGVLMKDTIVERTASDLQGTFVGHAQERIRVAMDEAQGGVLFIDEAYGFASSAYGEQALTELVALMTTPVFQQTVVIMAGYAHIFLRFGCAVACC
jgi:hypothetical protein